MKKYFLIALATGLLLLPGTVLAFETNALVNWHAPYDTFYPGEFDQLAFDFSLITTSPDTVKAIGLRNLGDATYLGQIKTMSLWTDAGDLGFQGMGVDNYIGDFSFSSSQNSWYIENLNQAITEDLHFFVSIETFTIISKTGSVKLQLPFLDDKNYNNSFDVGDFGLFMDSGNNGPTDANLANGSAQVFSQLAFDQTGPTIVISNLNDGQVINSENFSLTGLIRDQGNHGVQSFAVKINDELLTIDNYDPTNYEWTYDWQAIADGEYTISVQAYDNWGNLGQTSPINLEVLKQALVVENSKISLNKAVISNDGLDAVTVKVVLRDTNMLPITNWSVDVEVPEHVFISNQGVSDANGELMFDLRATSSGIKKINILSQGKLIGSVEFNVVDTSLADLDIEYGSLIQASSNSVYYYANDGKRYVFPNERVYSSWYDDFSAVQTITDEELAKMPIGGNVTYKPGSKMVKITTDPKVYAIDQNGTLRWIETETLAIDLYGSNWAGLIEDVADVFFTDYQVGDSIKNANEYNPQNLIDSLTSINLDKEL
jgi:Big-like domain-containing protein